MTERLPRRNYEGPARLVSEGRDERSIREEGRGIPKSYARYLTEQYGPEGVGWDFVTDRYAQENELKNVAHEPEFRLATEAMKNAILGKGYTLDDGTNVTGKVQRYVRSPDKGDVVVYPDGDVFYARNHS